MISLTLIGGISTLIAVFSFFLFKLLQISEGKDLKRSKINKKSYNGQKIKKNKLNPNEQFSCAFFHPNCSAGGGGERTLFAALLAIKSKFPYAKLTIFIKANQKNQKSLAEIQKKAKDDFNIDLPSDIQLIPLKTVYLAESMTWPRFTLLGQIIGSVVLGLETMIKYRPDVLIDTAGFPFIYPIIKAFNCKLVAYVHYPFISNDMIQKIQMKTYNNSAMIANNRLLRNTKIFYYRLLSRIYSSCGKCCDLAFTNSTWTHGHIIRSWKGCSMIKIVYPPCDLSPFINNISLERDDFNIKVISLSQFRPEKNHRLQLEIAEKVLKQLPTAEFIFIGGCRGSEDESRVKDLQEYAKQLGISESVQFKQNLPFKELLNNLQEATIGLHTMTEEHFGIGIVELMASGLIAIAHNSGGPRADIIKNETGYLCSSSSEYSDQILKIASMPQNELFKLRKRARESVLKRFTSEIFSKQFSECVKEIIY